MGRESQLGQSSENQSQSVPGCEAALFISRGQANDRERRFESVVFTLGSGRDCDLILGDNQFPELFAYIVRTHHEYHLRCLAPEPVLTVNAEDEVYTRLEDGDRIRCGPYEFRFHHVAASPDNSAEAAQLPSQPLAPRWVATDGQAQEGIAATRKLIREIQIRIGTEGHQERVHRRSA